MEALKEILMSCIGKRVENRMQDLVMSDRTAKKKKCTSQQTVYIKVRTLRGMKPDFAT